jgi:hypothetical protein
MTFPSHWHRAVVHRSQSTDRTQYTIPVSLNDSCFAAHSPAICAARSPVLSTRMANIDIVLLRRCRC